jgi:hypothetical protein
MHEETRWLWRVTLTPLVLLIGLGGVLWFGLPQTPAVAGPRRETLGPTACQDADAIHAVQAYQAPGQGAPLWLAAPGNLARDARPTQARGWTGDPTPSGSLCVVVFTASVGNAEQQYRWTYDLRTHQVDARDDATKRLSGW